VGALEGPDEVTHLGELHAHGLVGAASVVPGTLDHDSVREVRNFGASEQSVDGLVGRLDDLEVAGSARAGLEASLVAIALAPPRPIMTQPPPSVVWSQKNWPGASIVAVWSQ